LANHSWELHYVLYYDWPIRLLLTFYCLTIRFTIMLMKIIISIEPIEKVDIFNINLKYPNNTNDYLSTNSQLFLVFEFSSFLVFNFKTACKVDYLSTICRTVFVDFNCWLLVDLESIIFRKFVFLCPVFSRFIVKCFMLIYNYILLYIIKIVFNI